ncbi:hypothetical protein [Streptomyces piniterrae]|uniref:hypothetical protein n=1 Tax=Streptomyces piniterrae TaxID=2571125 RepID=UPI00145ECD4C|nr:hypothetical protein [Streptomyces piniterrae]
MLHQTFGDAPPYAPWTTAGATAGGTVLLALLATGLPVHTGLRRRATETLTAA